MRDVNSSDISPNWSDIRTSSDMKELAEILKGGNKKCLNYSKKIQIHC